MNWIEVVGTFDARPGDWSECVELFARHGCRNTLVGVAPESIAGCLLDAPGAEAEARRIEQELRGLGAREVRTRIVPDADWMEAFRTHFKPRRIGKRFVVAPTWESWIPGPGDLGITLDPEMAFGTGDHPTTRMCLELLEASELAGCRVLDLGCGTGILAIGASLLGAREVLALDIDAQSVEAARQNAARNGVECACRVGEAPEGEGWDVIASNIISATLIGLAPAAAKALAPRGRWIVSGVIEENWPDVLRAAERAGFGLEALRREDQWVAATLRRT